MQLCGTCSRGHALLPGACHPGQQPGVTTLGTWLQGRCPWSAGNGPQIQNGPLRLPPSAETRFPNGLPAGRRAAEAWALLMLSASSRSAAERCWGLLHRLGRLPSERARRGRSAGLARGARGAGRGRAGLWGHQVTTGRGRPRQPGPSTEVPTAPAPIAAWPEGSAVGGTMAGGRCRGQGEPPQEKGEGVSERDPSCGRAEDQGLTPQGRTRPEAARPLPWAGFRFGL